MGPKDKRPECLDSRRPYPEKSPDFFKDSLQLAVKTLLIMILKIGNNLIMDRIVALIDFLVFSSNTRRAYQSTVTCSAQSTVFW